MGMKVGKGGNLQNEPNVVPFIDILLVLLVIFMLMQPLSRMAFIANVPPPQQPQQEQQTQSDQIVLEILADGSYAINAEPVATGMLDRRIHEIYDNRPVKLIFIKAAESLLYEDVIRAMDIVKGAGVQVIGFTPRDANGGNGAGGG